MLLAFVLRSGAVSAAASAREAEGERQSASWAASRRGKAVPSAEGCFSESTPSCWQLLRFRGALVLREVHSWLGIRAAREETSADFVCSAENSAA